MDEIQKPIILDRKEYIPRKVRVTDVFTEALVELFFVKHPRLEKSAPESQKQLKRFLRSHGLQSVWIYYPWLNTVIRSLPERLYFLLRTARNRNLITEIEQKKYRECRVGICGLSLGSEIVSALVRSGGPKMMKIADHDTIEMTNLNRLRATLADVGGNKTIIAARRVWEIDPFADLHLYPAGITGINMKAFLMGNPKLDICIDEMDHIEHKIALRLMCRTYKIPVLMATDNGDAVILDVERFDLEPKRKIFHGFVSESGDTKFNTVDTKKWLRLSTKIIGANYLTERLQDSLLEVGKTISAVPRLGTTGSMAGSAVAFVVRRIANDQELPSGRYSLNLENNMISGYNTNFQKELRNRKTKAFMRKFGV